MLVRLSHKIGLIGVIRPIRLIVFDHICGNVVRLAHHASRILTAGSNKPKVQPRLYRKLEREWWITLIERHLMQKKILVTDDAMFMRVILKGILIPEKYSVVEACNGQEAIDQYAAHKPDLVFMDITMPIMDGLTALKTIKQQHPEACLVMCTAMGQQSMVIEAIKSGAKDFIVKPFQAERVLECVKKLIG